ncbi:MAG: hypothetical protein HY959_02990 [Ignavibacteriae bacterium]|nr:hypothetical protein [Ignavibacteriota bacterium]
MNNFNKTEDRFFLKTKIYNKIEEISKCLAAAVEFNIPYNGKVNLVLAEKNGRKSYTLIDNKFMKKGFYSTEFDVTNIPGGEYCYKFKTDRIEQTRELKLIK